jgi:endo-1,4-beta-xylanase
MVGTAAACATIRATTALDEKQVLVLPQVDTSKPLRAHAAAKGMLFGTTLGGELLENPAFADLVVGQCSIGVPESALKWNALRPGPDKYDFDAGDYLYRFAHSHGMKYRGHTLVWELALPSWFHDTVNAGNAKAMMLDHISVVVGHYAGKMHSWDVVNEAIEPDDGRPDGL